MSLQAAERSHDTAGSSAAPLDAASPAAASDSAAAQRGQARDLQGYLSSGREAGGLDGGMRAQAEQSLGIDLGSVRVHQGGEAAAANQAMGSTAFAHGNDIVLGSGARNDTNGVMAHELAHVAQQRGASTGVAMLSERGARGSAHEVDADQAATAIMVGAPVKVQQAGSEQVMCFEGAEHMDLGNAAYGSQMLTVGGVTLPAGAFTAMQGDFFGTWAELERTCRTNPALINEYYQILQREGRLRDAHRRDPANNPEPDSNGPIMLAGGGARATEYLGLASTNFNHFSDQSADSDALFRVAAALNPGYRAEIDAARGKFGMNIGQWLTNHMTAAQRTFLDGTQGKEFGGGAVAMDAGALHYLTDAFAAGHMRTPRTAMFAEYKRVFQAAARAQVNHAADAIPDTIDVTAWVRQGVHNLSPALLQRGADWAAAQLPAMTINLTAMKAAARAKLLPIADSIGETIASSVAGFSAKVLHDYDNEHGIDVFNDAGERWTAKGDHNLAGSPDNERIAAAAGAASAAHMRQIHAAGRSAQGQRGAAMPFISLAPITNRLPQMTDATRDAGTTPGGPRDWHWATMNPTYRAQVMQNGIDSIRGTVASATEAIKDKVREAVREKLNAALESLGEYKRAVVGFVDQIIERIMSYVPTIDPTVLINAILAMR